MTRECRRTSCCSRRRVSRCFSFGLYRARLNSGVNQRKTAAKFGNVDLTIDCVKLPPCRNDHPVVSDYDYRWSRAGIAY